MLLKLLMPQMERNIPGGAIVHWHKQVGEWVAFGDHLFDFRVVEVHKQDNRRTNNVNALVRVTSSDFGFLRQIVADVDTFLEPGHTAGILSLEIEEPLPATLTELTGAPALRVVTNYVRYQTDSEDY